VLLLLLCGFVMIERRTGAEDARLTASETTLQPSQTGSVEQTGSDRRSPEERAGT